MKYLVFTVSCLIVAAMVLKLTSLPVDLSRTTNFGYGYLTGIVLLIIIFSLTAFFSGKKIYKRLSEVEV
ncbi:hypothetical protein [Mucilaginibacter terrae]|nr:hypothetical protein [Mucilaginibacter terrae]